MVESALEDWGLGQTIQVESFCPQHLGLHERTLPKISGHPAENRGSNNERQTVQR